MSKKLSDFTDQNLASLFGGKVRRNALADLVEPFGLYPPLTTLEPTPRATNPFQPFLRSETAGVGLLTDYFTEVPARPRTLLGNVGINPGIGHNQPRYPYQWFFVTARFSRFLENLKITESQRQDGIRAFENVAGSLNRKFYGYSSNAEHSYLIGSWGKGDQIRPPRDVDVLFLLPVDVYHRYQNRVGNKQSQLLQEVREALLTTNPRTTISADRHVVVVPFSTVKIELAVGFRCTDGSVIVCDSKGEGRYVVSTAFPEYAELQASDQWSNGNTRNLIRMAKHWQHECNVPLKSFIIERLAVEFMAQWSNRDKSIFWYDWMLRDFFLYISSRANSYISMPGSGERIALGNEWLYKAQTAYRNALSACGNEHDNLEYLAGEDWRKIFGTSIPQGVS